MIFRRKKALEPNIIEQLKSRPGEIYKTDHILAVYAPGIDKVVLLTGNFKKLTDGEAERRIVQAMINLQASKN